MSKAIGIDLGTTNSVACYFDGDKAKILLNAQHEELTPSVVSCQQFDEGEEPEILVGRPAVSQAKLNPEDTIFSIKRLMGRVYSDEDVQRWKPKVNYAIAESKDPLAGLATVVMGSRPYMPEEISALILQEIKAYCEVALGDKITHAVITVPAYFGEPERAATREAGRQAGLVVKTLLPEPTAAAIAFGAEARTDEGNFVLVFDLGGGTFDISIISIVGSDYNVMEVSGDHFLGGDDFDLAVVDIILKHVAKTYAVDLSSDSRFRILAKAEAEAAKKSLSSASTEAAQILIPEAARAGDKVINVRLKIARSEFEDAIKPLVARCKQLVFEALAAQSLAPDLISDVLLVGGSTAVPIVRRTMEDVFGKDKVRHDVNPMHCVAIGAGILAHRMRGIECPNCKQVSDESESTCSGCKASLAAAKSVIKDMAITEITTNHFGIQAVSGSDSHAFATLVEKGTPLPMSDPKKARFFTAEEGQELIRVPVYEGLGSNVIQNSQIGVIEYALPVRLPVNHPIDIEFRLDRQSIVTVTIEVEGYPALRHERDLKRERVDQRRPQAEEHEEEPLLGIDDEEGDESQRQLAILEHYASRSEAFLAEYDGILAPAHKRKLTEAIAKAKEIVDNEKAAEAMDAIMNLDRLLLRCGTASLVEQARLTADIADQEAARTLQTYADQLKAAAERGDNATVNKLSAPIASLVRQVHEKAQGIERINTAETYGGLLRDKPKGS